MFYSKLFFLSFLILLINGQWLHAQQHMSKDSVQQAMSRSPAFSIYQDNYFITGTTYTEKQSKYNSDAKFQFSFKQRLSNDPLVWGAYAYLTYTQKSFWDIYRKSSPFAETNYNPGLQLFKPVYKNDALSGVLALSIEHESNGRDSTYSRSWNFVALGYTHFISQELNVTIKAWIPFMTSDNPDLFHYIGYGEAKASWMIKKDLLFLDMAARKGTDWNKGSIQANLSFRPSKNRNQYLMLQWWQGYEESLIDYRKSIGMLRIGIIIKPTFYRFY